MAGPKYEPPFAKPPLSVEFFKNKELFLDPERRQSGGLPDSPTDMPANATGESSSTPWKDMRR
jgi:hypothetical protein